MRLSSRMEAVATMVSSCRVLADIGTDHARVPIALVERGVADAAIAMDVREGPLARARENIAAAGMAGRIEVRLSDGTAALVPGEADVILIAGMGGALMRRILQDGCEVAHAARELVLQPQSEIAELRRFLWNEGYRILDENMVYEDGKYYTIIRAAWDEQSMTESEISAEYGPFLLARRNPVLLEYLQKEQRELQKILESLPQTDVNDRITKRRMELGEKLRRNQLAQQLYI